jgi:nucleotide-binding universal stress UspA family protein
LLANNLRGAFFHGIWLHADGSELAAKAESTGLPLAKQHGARVTVVTATEPRSAMSKGEVMAFHLPIEDYEKAAEQHAKAILAEVHEAAAKLDSFARLCTPTVGHPSDRQLVDHARWHFKADHMVPPRSEQR